MTPGQRCYDIIKRFEGFRSEAYQDSGGVWTIGYGHTRGVQPHDQVDGLAAVKLLGADLKNAAAAVERLVTVPLTPSMFDALCSFVFNLGARRLEESTLLVRLNDRRYLEVPQELLRWYRTPGSELGLLRRRAAEVVLFLEDGIPKE